MTGRNVQAQYHLYGYAREPGTDYHKEPSYEERVAILKKHGDDAKLAILEAAARRGDWDLIDNDLNGDELINEADQRMNELNSEYSRLGQYNFDAKAVYLGQELSRTQIAGLFSIDMSDKKDKGQFGSTEEILANRLALLVDFEGTAQKISDNKQRNSNYKLDSGTRNNLSQRFLNYNSQHYLGGSPDFDNMRNQMTSEEFFNETKEQLETQIKYYEFKTQEEELQDGLRLFYDSELSESQELADILIKQGLSSDGKDELSDKLKDETFREEQLSKLKQFGKDFNTLFDAFLDIEAKKYITKTRDFENFVDSLPEDSPHNNLEKQRLAYRQSSSTSQIISNLDAHYQNILDNYNTLDYNASEEERNVTRDGFNTSLQAHKEDYNADGIIDEQDSSAAETDQNILSSINRSNTRRYGTHNFETEILMDNVAENYSWDYSNYSNQHILKAAKDTDGKVMMEGVNHRLMIHAGMSTTHQKEIADIYKEAIEKQIAKLEEHSKEKNIQAEERDQALFDLEMWRAKQVNFNSYYEAGEYTKIWEDFNLDGFIDQKDIEDQPGYIAPDKSGGSNSNTANPLRAGSGILKAFGRINASGATSDTEDADMQTDTGINLADLGYRFNLSNQSSFAGSRLNDILSGQRFRTQNNGTYNFSNSALNQMGIYNRDQVNNMTSINIRTNTDPRLEELEQERDEIKTLITGTKGMERVRLSARLARVVKEISQLSF